MDLLSQAASKEIIFIGGKGGVGKTTLAAALACQLSVKNKKVLLISTDPAHNLSDIFNRPLSDQIEAINDYLSVLELNPQTIVEAHFESVFSTMKKYANPDHLEALKNHMSLAKQSPGGEEAAILEAICHWIVDYKKMGFEYIVFDTAPTGHTLRLMILPDMMEAWSDGLLHNHQRQTFLKKALKKLSKENADSPEDRRMNEINQVLNRRKTLFHQAKIALHDTDKTAIFLVMTPEPLPLAETKRAYQQLTQWHLPVSGIIVNQIIEAAQSESFWQKRVARQQKILSEVRNHFQAQPCFYYALSEDDIEGEEQLKEFQSIDCHL